MIETGIIYIATSPNGKSYIGQSIYSLSKRKAKHKQDAKKYSYAFANAINKYGIDAFIWRVLEDEIAIEDLNFKEKFYIRKYNTFRNGYNSTEGGDFNPMCYEKNRKKVVKNTRGVKHNIDQRGEKNPLAKITWCIVNDIRAYYFKSNMTQKEIAIKYKISRRTVGNIVNNKSWVDKQYVPPKFNKKDKLNKELANKIKKQYGSGKYTYLDLAKLYGVSFQTIGLIITNKIWL